LTLYLFANTGVEALGILHDMLQYPDFAQCNTIANPCEYDYSDFPTLLLKEILQRVDTSTGHLSLRRICFLSEFSGRVLATTGRNMGILFQECALLPPALDAFVTAMTTKEDATIGLTDVYMFKPYMFDDQTLFQLLKRNALKTLALYGYVLLTAPRLIIPPNSEEFLQGLLEAIRDSRSLQCLKIPYTRDFPSYESYVNFVNRLRSTSLRRLDISFHEFHDPTLPLPLNSLKELPLTCFSFEHVVLGQTRWNKLLKELVKCKTLTSLRLRFADWQEVHGIQAAVDFRNLLKRHSNIDSVETILFFDDDAYQMHVVPMLEYNRWRKKIRSLCESERELRSALIAEALGGIFATKPSQRYQLIKANVDVIASCLDRKASLQCACTSRKVSSSFQPFNESDTKRMKMHESFT